MTQSNLRRVFRNSVRLYFAPITGAIKEVRRELDRISSERNGLSPAKISKHS